MLLGGPRLALSRHRKVVIALSVITGLALSGIGLDKVKARRELQTGSLERGATRRVSGEGKDLRLRQRLEDPRQGRFLPGQVAADEAARPNRQVRTV